MMGSGSLVRNVERTAQMSGMDDAWRETDAPYDEEGESKSLTSSMWRSRFGRTRKRPGWYIPGEKLEGDGTMDRERCYQCDKAPRHRRRRLSAVRAETR